VITTLDPPLVTIDTRDEVYEFLPQSKVLAVMIALTERYHTDTIPWPKLKCCVLSGTRAEPLLSWAEPGEEFVDLEPRLRFTLINLHGQGFIRITPDGIKLLISQDDWKPWNNKFEERCEAARRLFPLGQ